MKSSNIRNLIVSHQDHHPSEANYQLFTYSSSGEESAEQSSLLHFKTKALSVHVYDDIDLLISITVDARVADPGVLPSRCDDVSTDFSHLLPDRASTINSDDCTQEDTMPSVYYCIPKYQVQGEAESVLCSDRVLTSTEKDFECSGKTSILSTLCTSFQFLSNYRDYFEGLRNCYVFSARNQPVLSTLSDEFATTSSNTKYKQPDSRLCARTIHELFYAARSIDTSRHGLVFPLTLLSKHRGLRWSEKEKSFRCIASGCSFECSLRKIDDFPIEELDEAYGNLNSLDGQQARMPKEKLLLWLWISARTISSRRFYYCDLEKNELACDQPVLKKVTDLMRILRLSCVSSSSSSAGTGSSAVARRAEELPLNRTLNRQSMGFERRSAKSVITHEQAASAKVMYFQPGDQVSLQRGQTSGSLSFEDAWSKMQDVQFVRREEQMKQGTKRDQEAYKMRYAYSRFNSFANNLLWRGKRPLELALCLVKDGLYLSPDEQLSTEEPLKLKARCSLCKRSFDITWGSNTEVYSLVASIRNLHERRAPTCPKVLGLLADDIPLTAEQQNKVMLELQTDVYNRAMKRDMKLPMNIQESSGTLTESCVSEQMENELFTVPKKLPSDENAWIIQPDDLTYFHSWPQFELSQQQSSDSPVVYAPQHHEEDEQNLRKELDVINLDSIEASLYRFARENLENPRMTKTRDSGFSKTLKTVKFEEDMIIEFLETDIHTLIHGQAPLFPTMIRVEARLQTFKSSLAVMSSVLLPIFMLLAKLQLGNDESKPEASAASKKIMTKVAATTYKKRQILWNTRLASALHLRQSYHLQSLQVSSEKAKTLAQAGFFCMPLDGSFACVCFWCGVALKNWANADPFLEHARHRFNCGFVLLSRGKQFVVETLEYYPPFNAQTESVALSNVLPPCKYDPPELVNDEGLDLQRPLERKCCDLPRYQEISYNYVLHFAQLSGQTYRFENREIRPRIETPSVLALAAAFGISVELITFATESRLKAANVDFNGVTGLLQSIWDIGTRMKVLDIQQVSEFVAVYVASEESVLEIDKRAGSAAQAAAAPSPRSQMKRALRGAAATQSLDQAPLNNGQGANNVTPGPKLCAICSLNPVCILLQPCNHVPLCENCVRSKKSLHTCVICKRKVNSWMKIFLSF